MSENPYEVMMPQGPFGKAVDKALAEENERYLNDPEAQRRDKENGERWWHIFAAEEAAGPHAVVLPVALAEDLLKILNGEPTRLPRGLLVTALKDRTLQAHLRGDENAERRALRARHAKRIAESED